jgi:hypothetical protein
MTLDDEQLDELLRKIEVPSGLKASLLTIPERDLEANEKPFQAKSWTAMLGTLAALAASIVLYFVITSTSPPKDNAIALADASKNEVAMLLAEMEQTNESIDAILRWREIPRNEEPSNEPIFDAKESVATALSLSWQAAIDRGASLESVREDLQYVVDKYPETAGAQRAQVLLQIN